MKRIATFSKSMKKAYKNTLKLAKKVKSSHTKVPFQCWNLHIPCKKCPFFVASFKCYRNANKTYEEWKMWAEEEV